MALPSVTASPSYEQLLQENQRLRARMAELEARGDAPRTDAALANARDILQATLNSITDGYYALDEQWRFLAANRVTEGHFGQSEAELRGQNIWELTRTPPDSPIYQHFQEACTTGHPVHFEASSALRPGFWAQMHLYPRGGGMEVYYSDISARKQAEEKLRESEEKYRRLFDNMSEGFAVGEVLCREDGTPDDIRFLEMNAAFERQSGLTREILNRPMKQVLPNLEQYWIDNYCRVAVSGQPIHFDAPNADTHRHYDVYCYSPAKGQFAIVFTDITHRKAAEEALRESEERFRVAQELSPDGFLIFRPLRDHTGGITDFLWIYENAAAARMNDTNPKEVCGKRVSEVLPHHDQSPFHQAYKEVAETGEVRVVEEAFYDQDTFRQRKWFRVAAIPTAGGDVAILVQDVTERREAEEALRESETLLREFLGQLPVGAALLDAQGGIQISNEAYRRMVPARIPSRDPEGRKRWRTWDAEGKLVEPANWPGARALRGERVVPGMEFLFTELDGREVWHRVSAIPFRRASGEIVGAISAIQDIDAVKRAEEALKERDARFTALLANLQSGVALLDDRGQFVLYNDSFLRIFGLDAQVENINSQDWSRWQVFAESGQLLPVDEHPVRKVALTGRPVRDQLVRIKRPSDAQELSLLISAEPILRSDGRPHLVICTYYDITDRQRAEDALRDSHERLKKVLEVETVGVMFWDLTTGRLVDANDTFLKMMGYSRSDVEARELTWQKFTPPEYHDVSLAEVRKFQATGRVGPYEKEYFCKDGTRRWLLFAGSALGKNQCVEFCVDIADRKQAEAALRESEAQLRLAAMAAEIGMWSWKPGTNQITVSANWRRLFGIGDEAPLSFETWRNALHPGDRQHAVEELNAAAAQHRDFDVEYRVVHPDGTLRWIIDRGRAWYDEQGHPTGMAGINLDITQRKRVEEALRLSSQRLELAMEAIQASQSYWDLRTGTLEWNARAYELMGYAPGSITPSYEAWRDRIHPDDLERVEREIGAGRNQHHDHLGEYRVLWPDGSVHWVRSARRFDFDAEGQPTTCTSIMYDITDLKAAEQQMREAKEAAEAANKAKDQFIAVLSHELRTPLTPAVAALAMLRTDMRLPSDVHEDLEMVSRNLDLEVRLIADLLDVSRIISGKLHLEKRLVDIAEAIREAGRIVAGDLDAKGQKLAVETPGAPYLTLGDAARLQQVFWNLLRNSIKFSPARSTIAIRARLVPAEHCPLAGETCPAAADPCPFPASGAGKTCGGMLIVEVIDKGSGIAPEMLPRLFNAFEQEEKARAFGGLGLGLSICRAVVEMHGGTISAHSDGPGCGATFAVRLPVAQCPLLSPGRRPAPGNLAEQRSRPLRLALRILLVEDNADTAKLMRRLLMAQGHAVTTAGSIGGALAALQMQRPDVLISDLGLPDGSGLDLMRQVVAQGQPIPAIALSGYGTPADIARSHEAGFAEHLVKPLSSVDALTEALARLVSGGPARRQ